MFLLATGSSLLTGPRTVRTCGEGPARCTACCKTHPVEEIAKPHGQWCDHCRKKQGCSAYAERPLPCRQFRCEWLKGWGAEADRPDRTGVVLDFVLTAEGLPGGWLQIWEVHPGALGSVGVLSVTRAVLQRDVWVTHIPAQSQKRLYVPEGRVIPAAFLPLLAEEHWKIVLSSGS